MAMIDTLRPAFAALGIELSYEAPFYYRFEYEYLPFGVVVDSDDPGEPVYYFGAPVPDPLEGGMDEYTFTTALDVTRTFHPDVNGEWNDGQPYLESKQYLVDGRQVPPDVLLDQLEAYKDAYVFLLANICLVEVTRQG